MIPLFWHASDNFGDALAPWLVEKISGQEVAYFHPDETDISPYVVLGSIFGHQLQRGVIWGAGCAFESDLDPKRLRGPSSTLRVIATRGPLSRALVEEVGHAPVAVGDPALLLSRFYTPRPRERHSAGIICSWVDYAEVADRYAGQLPVLNASTPVEEVIDTIASWDVVISGCLHGLVAAVAYQIPVVWATFSNRLLGDGFKFRDFFATFGIETQGAVSWPDPSKVDKHVLDLRYEGDDLLACCPFKNTSSTIPS